MTFSLFGLWSKTNLQSTRTPERSIASDFNSIMSKLIAPVAQAEKLNKLKNNVWNKVMGPHDFQNFNDQEYFRWIEIYKDGNAQLSNLNPVSIEQKMALIEVINKRLTLTPFYTKKNLSKDVQRLSLYKIKKIQNHMTNIGNHSSFSHSDIYNFATDLMIILKGPPPTLMEYYTKNKTAKMNVRILGMVQEDILMIGLKGILERIPENSSAELLERGKLTIKKFFFHKTWKHLALPHDIEWLEKIKLSDELLEKIMIDGLENHDEELIEQLKKQDMVDHYERFRKVYRPIAFSIGFYFYFERFNQNQNEEKDNLKFIDFFKNLSDKIQANRSPDEKSDAP